MMDRKYSLLDLFFFFLLGTAFGILFTAQILVGGLG